MSKRDAQRRAAARYRDRKRRADEEWIEQQMEASRRAIAANEAARPHLVRHAATLVPALGQLPKILSKKD